MARKATPQPKTPPEVAPDEQVGVGGTALYGGIPSSDERNPEMASPKRRYAKYRELFYNVDIIGAGMSAFLRLVGGVDWTLSPPKNLRGASPSEAADKADLAMDILNDMTSPWQKVVQRQAIYPFFGFAMSAWRAK